MSPFLSEQFPSGLVLPSVQVGKPRAEHDYTTCKLKIMVRRNVVNLGIDLLAVAGKVSKQFFRDSTGFPDLGVP